MKRILACLLILALLLSGCGGKSTLTVPTTTAPACTHTDANDNGLCDSCSVKVSVTVDIYNINDLHGKIVDSENQPGVDEMTTFFRAAREQNENVILLSSGDMWQGSSESNLTGGLLTTEWMNALDFAAMALGNHEFDWGEAPIEENAEAAEFPFLAINIYEHKDDTLADYCQPSTTVDLGAVQIGIIGAIGDCYSSIAADKTEDVYFKVGDELTALVKAESEKLRSEGADFIIYMLHDGYDQSTGTSLTRVNSENIDSYYDISLSQGFVDLVFEGHTHQQYLLRDIYGIYHLQNKGENKGGISHVSVELNPLTGSRYIRQYGLIGSEKYENLTDDPIVDQLLEKYDEQIAPSREVLGYNAAKRSSKQLKQIVADRYYALGMEQWGDKYDIALGGGYISVRSPYDLAAGDVSYGQLQMLLPFDNQLVLCSIKGRELESKFFETDNKNYFISYGDYGESIRNSIDPDATYYIVTDTYSSLYTPNKLTEIERYDPDVFARDLVADYIKEGGLK